MMTLLYFVLITLPACGGGGGGGRGPVADSGGGGGDGGGGTPPPAGPAFSGFDFALAAGNFWEYKWDYYQSSWMQGGSPTSKRDSGRFWVVLGSPAITIQGVSAYPVTIYGKSRNTDKIFGPRWKYLAMSDNQMLGSTDGASLIPFFDAQLGKWAGGGFFATLPSTLILAQNGTISATNTYIAGAAIVGGRTANQSLCEIIGGYRICGDASYNYAENEYFRENIGPVGYYYANDAYFAGPPSSTHSWRHNVGMTASSFTGQASPLVTGVTAINSASTAQAISTTHPVIGTVWHPGLVSSNMTQINVTVVDDNGNTVSGYQPYVENWYTFTLVSAKTVTVTLSFEGSPSNTDLDLFLMNSTASTLYGYSVHNNPTSTDQHERIVASLGAGTYRIGVDHAAPLAPSPLRNSPSMTYTLVFE
jgi:hypothetical protein